MADPLSVIEAAQAGVLARERRQSARLVKQYGLAWRRVHPQLLRLARDLQAQAAAGKPIRPKVLARSGSQLDQLVGNISRELHDFARFSSLEVTTRQAKEVQVARADTIRAIQAGLKRPAELRMPSPAAVADAVGTLPDGDPIDALIGEIPKQVAQRARKAFLEGMAMGRSPEAIVDEVRGAFGHGLLRAKAQSRTELMRAVRAADATAMKANQNRLSGWIWTCTLGGRSCPTCWAMHGTFHELGQPMGTHPGCRCRMAAFTRQQAFSTDPRPLTGEQLFAGLPEAEQRAILGPGRYKLYAEGRMRLAEVVAEYNHPRWGQGRRTLGIAELLGKGVPPRSGPVARDFKSWLASQQKYAPRLRLPTALHEEEMLRQGLAGLRAENGATVSRYFGDLAGAMKLYSVTVFPERGAVVPQDAFTTSLLRAFIQNNRDVLQDPRYTLGIWRDVTHGEIVLDISGVTDNRRHAMALGRHYNQQGVFHLGKVTRKDDDTVEGYIPTGGNGTMIDALPPYNQRMDVPRRVLGPRAPRPPPPPAINPGRKRV